MDSLAGYIATLCVGSAGTYLSQFLKPKIKIHYWLPHSFIYRIPYNQLNPSAVPALMALPGQQPPPANFFLLSQSVTIQNLGRECAEWVEIVHAQRPDFLELQPPLNYKESTTPTGEHSLRVESLAPKEFFTIQFLCYTHQPILSYIRSEAGHASSVPWQVVRKFSRWVYVAMWLVMLTGAGFCLYWVIKGGIFVLKGVNAMKKQTAAKKRFAVGAHVQLTDCVRDIPQQGLHWSQPPGIRFRLGCSMLEAKGNGRQSSENTG
jgi:hypothetical protein